MVNGWCITLWSIMVPDLKCVWFYKAIKIAQILYIREMFLRYYNLLLLASHNSHVFAEFLDCHYTYYDRHERENKDQTHRFHSAGMNLMNCKIVTCKMRRIDRHYDVYFFRFYLLALAFPHSMSSRNTDSFQDQILLSFV